MQTFLKRWSGTKHSLPPACKTCKAVRAPWRIVSQCLSVLLHLGEQIPFLYFFFGLGSVSQFLQLLGSYLSLGLWFSLNSVLSHLLGQTELILCRRGLPGVFHKWSLLPCLGGSKETAPGRHCDHLFSSRKMKTNCRQFRQSNLGD